MLSQPYGVAPRATPYCRASDVGKWGR